MCPILAVRPEGKLSEQKLSIRAIVVA